MGDIRRFRTVVTIMFEEGLSFFVDELRLRYLVPVGARLRRALTRGRDIDSWLAAEESKEGPPPEVRFRRAMERLGPTFIKLGQILSTRRDLLPQRYTDEFAKLQDRVPALRPGVAEKVVEQELGQPIENIFSDFSRKPLAAASLAEVHRAKLRDGTPVAVKVARPGVEAMVKNDIHILAYLARLLEVNVPASRKYRPGRFVAEFADWTMRELDFEEEGANLDRFRENFRDEPAVVVPKVFWPQTKKHVLTMELVEGVKVDDLKALKRAGIDPERLAVVGLRAGFRQLFVDGFFHADPHPGNLVALKPKAARDGGGEPPEPRLGIYDFGIVGSVSEKTRLELVSCFVCFANGDIEGYVAHVADLAESLEDADLDSFNREARALLSGVIFKPTEKKRIGATFYSVILAAAGNGLMFSRDLLLVGKALVTIESVGLALYPEVDLAAELKPFLGQVFRRELDPRKLARDAQATGLDTLYMLKHLPEQTRQLLDRLVRGEFSMKIDLQELRDLKEEFDRENDIRVIAIVAAAVLLASAMAIRLDAVGGALTATLGKIGFSIALLLIVWVFFLVNSKPK